MLCYAMLCYAMLCYAMLCYAMLCYAMLCYAIMVTCRAALPCARDFCTGQRASSRYAMVYHSMLWYAMVYCGILFAWHGMAVVCLEPGDARRDVVVRHCVLLAKGDARGRTVTDIAASHSNMVVGCGASRRCIIHTWRVVS
jgi:hypothetical protein